MELLLIYWFVIMPVKYIDIIQAEVLILVLPFLCYFTIRKTYDCRKLTGLFTSFEHQTNITVVLLF